MTILAMVLSGLLSRLDGWGRGDGFFPFYPFNLITCGGINYTRGLIGVPAYLISHNPWHMISFFLVGVTFWIGENNWLTKLVGDKWCWIITGFMWGLASLNIIFAFWFSIVFFSLMTLDRNGSMDHAYFEFLAGFLVLSFLWI